MAVAASRPAAAKIFSFFIAILRYPLPKAQLSGRSGLYLTHFGSKNAEKWSQRRFFLRFGMLNEFPTQSRQSLEAWSPSRTGNFVLQKAVPVPICPCASRFLP